MTGPALPLWEAVARLLFVILLAGLVGLERQLRDQDAGIRTHMLVGLGSALFVITGNYAWDGLPFGNAVGVVLDPSRVVAYVVTGIGFLGAGAIIKSGFNVRGLTTAASLWVVAAVGVGVGAGEYWLGTVATGIILLSLWPVRKLSAAVGLRSTSSHSLTAVVSGADTIQNVFAVVAEAGGDVYSASVTAEEDAQRVVIVFGATKQNAERAFHALVDAPAMRTVSLES
ncbi:MAG: MgtC/SapB family protein [Gaiella sp.]